MLFETRAKIAPRHIVVYTVFYGDRQRSILNTPAPRKTNVSRGILSPKAAKRMREAIDWLNYTAKWKTVFVKDTQTNFRYKLNFITLTLPSKQIHNDTAIVKNCLSPFLETWCKRRKGLLYVWKAETQDNGNIHFHIVSNAFYHFLKLRHDWNYHIDKLDYVKRSGRTDPNSTDVHALNNKKDIGQYLTSYFSKKDTYTKVLKRYFKRYGKHHANKNNLVCNLPKNYFKHLKRRVSSAIWSASKALLNIKITSKRDDQSTGWKVLDYLAKNNLAIRADYCTIYPLELYAFEEIKEFKILADKELSNLFQIQESNRIKEIIHSLN